MEPEPPRRWVLPLTIFGIIVVVGMVVAAAIIPNARHEADCEQSVAAFIKLPSPVYLECRGTGTYVEFDASVRLKINHTVDDTMKDLERMNKPFFKFDRATGMLRADRSRDFMTVRYDRSRNLFLISKRMH